MLRLVRGACARLTIPVTIDVVGRRDVQGVDDMQDYYVVEFDGVKRQYSTTPTSGIRTFLASQDSFEVYNIADEVEFIVDCSEIPDNGTGFAYLDVNGLGPAPRNIKCLNLTPPIADGGWVYNSNITSITVSRAPHTDPFVLAPGEFSSLQEPGLANLQMFRIPSGTLFFSANYDFGNGGTNNLLVVYDDSPVEVYTIVVTP